MVMAKSKRKKVMSMNLREADLVAPLIHTEWIITTVNSRLKTLDYSSEISSTDDLPLL